MRMTKLGCCSKTDVGLARPLTILALREALSAKPVEWPCQASVSVIVLYSVD